MRESVRLCKCDKKKCKKKSKEQKSVRNNACGAKLLLLGAGLWYRSVADGDKFLTDTTATTRAKREGITRST